MKKLVLFAVGLIAVLSCTRSIATPVVSVVPLTTNILHEPGIGGGGNNGQIRVSRTGGTTGELRVYCILSGTATTPYKGSYDAEEYCLAKLDYITSFIQNEIGTTPDCELITDKRLWVTIPEGESSQDIDIYPWFDRFYEPANETMIFTIVSDPAYSINGSSNSVTMEIVDTFGQELFCEFLQSSSIEGTTNTLRIRRNKPSATNETWTNSFQIVTAFSSATYSNDYTIDGISLVDCGANITTNVFEVVIPANQEFLDLQVNILSDTNEECNETLLIHPLITCPSCEFYQPPYSAKLIIKDLLVPVYTNTAGGFNTNNDFYFTITKPSGAPSTAIVYTSGDLVTWTSNNTVSFSGNSASFTDTSSDSSSATFYRVRNGTNDSVAPVGFYRVSALDNLIANQLDHPGGNTLSNLFPVLPDGTLIYYWDGDSWEGAFEYFENYGWFPGEDFELNPGEGVKIELPESTTLNFYGTVRTGTLNKTVSADFDLVSSIAPQAGDVCFLKATHSPMNVSKWVTDHYETYSADDELGWYPSVPTISLGEAFFIDSSGFSWSREFKPLDCP